jgi:hypothetical protein
MRIQLLGVLFFVAASLFSGQSHGANLEFPSTLDIVWDDTKFNMKHKLKSNTQGNTKNAASPNKMVLNSCRALFDSMKVNGNHPWGFGLFNKFSCKYNSKLLTPKKPAADWKILIAEDDVSTRISIFYKENLLILKTFNAKGNFKSFITIPEMAQKVGAFLLDQFPAVGVFQTGALKRGAVAIKASSLPTWAKSKSFEKLFVYRLTESKKKDWDAVSIGTAQFKSKSSGKNKKYRGKFKLDASSRSAIKQSPLLYHLASGRRSLKDLHGLIEADLAIYDPTDESTVSEIISRNLGGMFQDITDTVAHGYSGIRYGVPIASGNDLLSKANIIQILVEIRGGPVEGLRAYIDLVPEVKSETDDIETLINWTRYVLGWSFGYDVSDATGGLVNTLDFAPKLGVWSFDAQLAVPLASGESAKQSLKLDNAISTGIEIGVEKQYDLSLVRLW